MELLNRQKKVLVLDKDNRIASVVDEMMWYGDWDVSVTYDPNTVFDMAKAYQPDLIILDYFLLDNDCELICRDFKNDAALHDVPLIVVTAYKTKKTKADCFKCDALFIKPLDMEVLASRMDYLMAS
jgi:DNA-binding response OmpR family regulator